MKVTLQSQKNYNRVGILNSATGEIEIMESSSVSKLTLERIQGYFSELDSRLVCFYRVDEDLCIMTNGKVLQLQAKDRTSLEPIRANQYEFKVMRGEETILSLVYERPKLSPSLDTLRFFNSLISEEDFDICLFMHNVLTDPRRMERVFRRKPS